MNTYEIKMLYMQYTYLIDTYTRKVCIKFVKKCSIPFQEETLL